MEGYYVEKTWSLNHIAETLYVSETFVKKAAFRLYQNKTRAVSVLRQRESQRNERYQVAETAGF